MIARLRRPAALLFASFLFSLAASSPGALAAPPLITGTMDVEEVRPGQRGLVHTVITGNTQETIEVEILGVLPDGIAPRVPMIVARFVDERGRWTGVAAGMSGSPVTIEGRLVGALSYSIGAFSKEPICGITPIDTMLALESLPSGLLPWTPGEPVGSEAPSRAAAYAGAPERLVAPEQESEGAVRAPEQGAPALPRGAGRGLAPLPVALAATGFAPSALEELVEALGERGLRAQLAPAGLGALGGAPRAAAERGGDAAAHAPERLEPGDPVAALLVWGDLTLGATGTVTWREDEALLAFGHPFLGFGRVELPMASAEILWTIPSELSSFKLSRIGAPIGVVEQDRLTAIRGRLGPVPEGMPFRVRIARGGQEPLSREVFIARDPFLTPLLANAAFASLVLSETGNDRDEAWTMRAKIRMADGRVIPVSGAVPGTGRAGLLALALNVRLNALMQPPVALPPVESVEVELEAVAPEGAWQVVGALPDRLAARPGETLRLSVDLLGPRGERRRERLLLEVPEDASEGTHALVVGSESRVAAELGSLEAARLRTARRGDDFIDAMSADTRDAALVAALARPAEGIVADGGIYPALPNSVHMLMRSRPGGEELYRARLHEVSRVAIELERPVTSGARIRFEVRPR